MVDMLIAAAALAASNDVKALETKAETPSSGEETRSVVPTERRRIARATIPGNDLAALKPLIDRAKMDAKLSDTRNLLDQAERELKNGNHEQAMLTLDGATLQIERMRPDLKGNTNFIDSFQQLELRESSLREKIGGDQPTFVPLKTPIKLENGETAPAKPADEKKKEDPKLPKRDELPVG